MPTGPDGGDGNFASTIPSTLLNGLSEDQIRAIVEMVKTGYVLICILSKILPLAS